MQMQAIRTLHRQGYIKNSDRNGVVVSKISILSASIASDFAIKQKMVGRLATAKMVLFCPDNSFFFFICRSSVHIFEMGIFWLHV